MKTFIGVLTLLSLSGCALMGVYGPEAQERAQRSLEQLGEGLGEAGAAYARGYANSYNAYQPYCPSPYHSGFITRGDQSPAYYSLDPSGGYIIQPGEAPIIISGY